VNDLPEKPLDDRLPPNTGMFGLKLFLASLTMLFGASLVAYMIIRLRAQDRGLEYGMLHMPAILWLSTAIMIASSITIHMALRGVRAGRQAAFRRAMVATAVLGLVFLAMQGPGLYQILQWHEAFRVDDILLYGLVLMLIGLHALHVIGGIIPLGAVTAHALQGKYHAGRHDPVRYCAAYWHFLDIVWLVMFGLFYSLG
jgi:cytochrome c oxidase subunit III